MNGFDKIRKSLIGEEGTLKQRMASGAFWNIVGTSLAKALVLLGGIICARLLGKDTYGEFGMVRSTINMFLVFGGTGLGLTAVKYISEFKASQTSRIGSIYYVTNLFAVIVGAIISTLVFLFAKQLAVASFNTPDLENPIKLGAVILFITCINLSQNGTLAGLERFRAIATNTFIGSVAELTLMIIGAYYYGLMGAIAGYGCGYLVILICNNVSIRKQFKKLGVKVARKDVGRRDYSLLVSFSLPAILQSIVASPVLWFVRSMLVRTNGFGDAAVYEAADQWRIIILFIPAAVSQIVLPILSSLVNVDSSKFKKVLLLNIALNASIALIIALGICIFSSYIMASYGNGFSDPLPLIILAISTVFTAIGNVIGLSISSRAKMWAGLALNSIWGVLVITFSYIFLNMGMGVTGLSLAVLCAFILHTINQSVYLRYILKHSPNITPTTEYQSL